MKPRSLLLVPAALLVLQGLPPGASALIAQDPPPPEEVPAAEVPDDPPPPGRLGTVERRRSRMCVGGIARLQAVSTELQPLRARAARIEALHRAVVLEDSLRVTPLDDQSPLEATVRAWFQADGALGRRYAESDDEAILDERREAKREMLDRLEGAHQEVTGDVQGIVGSAEGLDVAMRDCEGAVFIRSAVRDACRTGEGPLCDALEDEAAGRPLRFVDDAEALWGIEQLRPWSEPTPLRPAPDGSLTGARTGALARRGNLSVFVSVEAVIRPRSGVDEEEAARLDARLEQMGIAFEHPDFVMAPAMSVEANITEPLDEETHYFLHFGDLADPEADVIWAFVARGGGPLSAVFPVEEPHLVRLAQGEGVNLTAVRLPEGGTGEGDALWSVPLPDIGQAPAVLALLQYMVEGGLGRDLAALIPPGSAPQPEPGS